MEARADGHAAQEQEEDTDEEEVENCSMSPVLLQHEPRLCYCSMSPDCVTAA